MLSSEKVFGQYTSEDAEPYTDSTAKKNNPLNKLSFKERLYTGGNVNLGFVNGFAIIMVNPIAGYRITHKFSAGLGGKYIYYGNLGKNTYGPTFRNTYYGGSIFSRYLFNDSFFAHGEFELLNSYHLDPNNINYGSRALAKMFFLGAGYNTRLGGNFTAQIMILYDFINDANSPYQYNYMFGPVGPPLIYKIGFTIGL